MRSKVLAAMVVDENVPMVFVGPFGLLSGGDINKFEKATLEIGNTGPAFLTEKAS
jgi:hypothetical protein